MNIIIPLGRLTRDLRAAGFVKPLQATCLLGRPVLFWILDNLKIGSDDVVWMVISAKDEALYQLYSSASAEYREMTSNGQLRLIPLHFATSGVAETLHIANKYLGTEFRSRRTVCLNGDTIFKFDVLEFARCSDVCDLCCILSPTDPTFTSAREEGLHLSYGILSPEPGRDENCQDSYPVRELTSISVHSDPKGCSLVCVGAYIFSSAELLDQLCSSVIRTASHDSKHGFPEVVDCALKLHVSVTGINVDAGESFYPLKTREMLDEFISLSVSDPQKSPIPKHNPTHYVFEMYGGIIDETGSPRFHVVTALQLLKQLGHRISVASNRGCSYVAINSLISTLNSLKITYDEIRFDSTLEDPIFIRSNVVDIRGDLCAMLGLPSSDVPNEECVKSRHFNKVTVQGNVVRKESASNILAGEAFYYDNIPLELADLFPKLLTSTTEGGMATLTLSRIPGLTCSQLMVNRCFCASKLNSVLRALLRMHTTETPRENAGVNYYANYVRKVTDRYANNRSIYDSLTTRANSVFEVIVSKLNEYEIERRANITAFIHGDPVFSNIIFAGDEPKFIDMNGQLGGNLTTEGDSTYDLAKVLQSIYGYDHIILDVSKDAYSLELSSKLRAEFRVFVEKNYKARWKDIQVITASLYFSLIPLHDNVRHHDQFFNLCEQVLHDVQYDEHL
jgi:hypothetical protein